MATLTSTKEQLLAEAKFAYHKLATGTAAVTVKDANGESITYNLASAGVLKQYIQELHDAIVLANKPSLCEIDNPLTRSSRPMSVWL